ncbi:MAG: cell wall-binding repeat-containing protein [Acidimicrobiales bacterium]
MAMRQTSGPGRLARAGLAAATVITVSGARPAAATQAATANRLGGETRYATAAAIAEQKYPNGVSSATLTSGVGFADALGGSFLAGTLNDPILLTDPAHLSSETKDALTKLNVQNIDILGGTDAVSQSVQDELGPSIHVTRYSGPTRYDTDAKAVEAVGAHVGTIGGQKTAVIASGTTFPDAVAASGLAYHGFPIVLTDPVTLSPQAAQTMQDVGIKQVLVMGGPHAVSADVEAQINHLGIATLKRFAGADRIDTAVQLANFEDATAELGFSPAETVLYRSDDFADSLAGAPYAEGSGGGGKNQLPAGPGGSNCGDLAAGTAAFLQAHATTVARITALGGTFSICQSELDQAVAAAGGAATPTPAASGAPTVRVAGNALVDGSGQPLRLLGMNRDGTEYACAQGWGIFDGPNDDASVTTMASWHINAVRVPLNEACWLGINGLDPSRSGATYQKAIADFVSLLHKHGLVAILDLHVATPGSTTVVDNLPIADTDHSPTFWKSVATAYKDDHSVVFDLFNEPHDISWTCWRDGCPTNGYQGAGMQSLVDAVRSTGATQPLLVGGIGYAGDLSSWLQFRPSDPANEIAASFHTYGDFPCDASCLGSVASVAQSVPVVSGEIGDKDCTHAYIDSYMAFADAHKVSYLAWTWNAGQGWDCKAGPTVITDYNGTPTDYGIGYRDHLQSLH